MIKIRDIDKLENTDVYDGVVKLSDGTRVVISFGKNMKIHGLDSYDFRKELPYFVHVYPCGRFSKIPPIIKSDFKTSKEAFEFLKEELKKLDNKKVPQNKAPKTHKKLPKQIQFNYNTL